MIGITVAGIIFREKKMIEKVSVFHSYSTNEYRAKNSTEKWIE
jgi:hypothetical protein